MSVILRLGDNVRDLEVDRWSDPATDGERALLRQLDGPVLDLGCGPGRLVVALGELGIPALGIDESAAAVHQARGTGAPVLHRSLFERLPLEGRWRTVLLFDGNIGIGGDPSALLRRTCGLVTCDGTIIAEVDPPGTPSVAGCARLEHDGTASPRFPWAHVSADVVDCHAAEADLMRERWVRFDGRWFAILRPLSS